MGGYPTGSYLELYTSYFGWIWYGRFYEVVTALGLHLLPLLVILVRNSWEPMNNPNDKAAAVLSVNRTFLDLLAALLVMTLAFAPAITMNGSQFHYTNAEGRTVSAADSGSAYGPGGGGFGAVEQPVRVPLLWYLGVQVANGINRMAAAVTPDTPDLQRLSRELAALNIADPRLRAETNDFYSQCFRPARARYQRLRPDTPAIRALLEAYGTDDTEWIGSHILLETPGYYRACPGALESCDGPGERARQPVAGFEAVNAGSVYEGRPDCDQWWGDGGSGLKGRLLAEGGADFDWSVWNRLAQRAGLTDRVKAEDAAIRHMLFNAPPNYIDRQARGDESGWFEHLLDFGLKDALAIVGTALAAGTYALVMDILIDVLPMVQAVLLFGLYAVMLFAIVISGYSPTTVINLGFAVFTVLFWSTLWHLAYWLHNNLLAAMYQSENGLEAFLRSGVVGHHNDWALGMVTGLFLVGVTYLWVWVMNLARVSALKGAQGMTDQLSEGGRSAAKEGLGTLR